MTAAPLSPLAVGALVRTSYGTGPYVVTRVSGPCTCPEYVRSLDGDQTPSEPHYHLECRDAAAPSRRRGSDSGPSYLNGYRPDGSNVWRRDRLELVEYVQARLFR